MKNVLLQAARERCLALSPDIWSDDYKKQSYLGCTAHWIDDKWALHSMEIFCLPFNTPDKKAPSVMKVRKKNSKIMSISICRTLFQILGTARRFIHLRSRSIYEKYYLGNRSRIKYDQSVERI